MIKKILILSLLFVNFNQSQASWFERFAHYAARDTFADIHNHSVGKEEQTFLEKSVKDAVYKGTLAVRVGYHARGLFTQYCEHIRYSKKTPLREKLVEEFSGLPCTGTRLVNNHYDFSKIKKQDEISDLKKIKSIRVSLDELGVAIEKKIKVTCERDGITLPCIMVYTLSPNKKVYFVMDLHYKKESEDLVKKLCQQEKFSHVIIESCFQKTPPSYKEQQFSKFYSAWHLRNNPPKTNSYDSMDQGAYLLSLKGTMILPGEQATSYELYEDYKKEGMDPTTLAHIHLVYESEELHQGISKEYDSLKKQFPNKESWERFRKENTQTITNTGFSAFVGSVHTTTPQSLVFHMETILKDTRNYCTGLRNKTMYARDKKAAARILDTALDPDNTGNILVIYGAAHGETQKPLHEQWLGKAEYISARDYMKEDYDDESYYKTVPVTEEDNYWPYYATYGKDEDEILRRIRGSIDG